MASSGAGARKKGAAKSTDDVNENIVAVLRRDYGLPAWSLVSGNLQIVTKALHRPKGGGVGGPSAYDFFSGNMPPLSFDILKETDPRA
jgi:hypothetical protein